MPPKSKPAAEASPAPVIVKVSAELLVDTVKKLRELRDTQPVKADRLEIDALIEALVKCLPPDKG